MAEPSKRIQIDPHTAPESPPLAEPAAETESTSTLAMSVLRAEVARQAAARVSRYPEPGRPRATPMSNTEAQIAQAEKRVAVTVGETVGRLQRRPDSIRTRRLSELLRERPGESLFLAGVAGFVVGTLLRRR